MTKSKTISLLMNSQYYEQGYEQGVSDAEQKSWIPCNERLPKPKETENLIAKYYLVQNEYGDMMVARWDGKGWEQMYQYEYLEDNVIAWQPLPKPYSTESED